MTNDKKNDTEKVLDILNIRKIFLPLIIGLASIFYLFYKNPDFSIQNLKAIKDCNIAYLISTILVLMTRDFLYTYRIRVLTKNSINWWECFIIIVLWEFSSAVTPSAIGGTFIAVFLFMHAGVSFGKSLAYVMTTAVLDNLFYIVMAPVSYNAVVKNTWNIGFSTKIFWISYIVILIYTIFMSVALYIKPTFIKWIMTKITSIKLLKRFQDSAIKQGNDLILASQNMGNETIWHWIKLGLITYVVWCCRYGILNTTIQAFVPCDFSMHLDIFHKNIVMWIMMLISPTPGGSGLAEYFFNTIYGPLLSKYTIIIVLLWRIVTYYVYLIAGFVILPDWIKKIKKEILKNK